MLRNRIFAPLALSGLIAVSVAGCGESTPVGSAGGVNAGFATADPATWISGVALGTPDDPDRGFPGKTAEFDKRDTIVLRMNVASAPADSRVTVRWFSSAGKQVGEESRTAEMGQAVMTFVAPEPGELGPDEYRVQVLVDGSSVQEEHFRVTCSACPEAHPAHART